MASFLKISARNGRQACVHKRIEKILYAPKRNRTAICDSGGRRSIHYTMGTHRFRDCSRKQYYYSTDLVVCVEGFLNIWCFFFRTKLLERLVTQERGENPFPCRLAYLFYSRSSMSSWLRLMNAVIRSCESAPLESSARSYSCSTILPVSFSVF